MTMNSRYFYSFISFFILFYTLLKECHSDSLYLTDQGIHGCYINFQYIVEIPSAVSIEAMWWPQQMLWYNTLTSIPLYYFCTWTIIDGVMKKKYIWSTGKRSIRLFHFQQHHSYSKLHNIQQKAYCAAACMAQMFSCGGIHKVVWRALWYDALWPLMHLTNQHYHSIPADSQQLFYPSHIAMSQQLVPISVQFYN